MHTSDVLLWIIVVVVVLAFILLIVLVAVIFQLKGTFEDTAKKLDSASATLDRVNTILDFIDKLINPSKGATATTRNAFTKALVTGGAMR
ncbi:Hypothetical protein POVN_LOCUS226 [uncultured virus]|nr:Hypothetical protein POVN_LOCUS226 [uncultured virus]